MEIANSSSFDREKREKKGTEKKTGKNIQINEEELPFIYSFQRNHISGEVEEILAEENSYLPFRSQPNCLNIGSIGTRCRNRDSIRNRDENIFHREGEENKKEEARRGTNVNKQKKNKDRNEEDTNNSSIKNSKDDNPDISILDKDRNEKENNLEDSKLNKNTSAVWLQDDEAQSFYQKGYFVLQNTIPPPLLKKAKEYIANNYDNWMKQVIRQDDWRIHFDMNFDKDLLPVEGCEEEWAKERDNEYEEYEAYEECEECEECEELEFDAINDNNSKKKNKSKNSEKNKNKRRIKTDHAALLNLLLGSEKLVGRLYCLLGKMPKGIFYSQIALRTPVVDLSEQRQRYDRQEQGKEKEKVKEQEQEHEIKLNVKKNKRNENVFDQNTTNTMATTANITTTTNILDKDYPYHHYPNASPLSHNREKAAPYTIQTNLGPYSCYGSKAEQIDNRPGTNYHIDGQSNIKGTRFPDYWTIEIGIALTDQMIPNCGNFTVWEGFHDHPTIRWHDYAEQKKNNTLPDLGEPTQICLHAGDVVFAHVLLPHRGGMNVGLQVGEEREEPEGENQVDGDDDDTGNRKVFSPVKEQKQLFANDEENVSPPCSKILQNKENNQLLHDQNKNNNRNNNKIKEGKQKSKLKAKKRLIPDGTRQMFYMRIQGEEKDYYNSEQRAKNLLHNPWCEFESFLANYIQEG